MKISELKFLLKLLGKSAYRATIAELNPSDKTPVSERNKICADLTTRGMVAHSREVKQFRISPAGKTLLSQDITQLPLTDLQMTVLKTCETRSIKPGALNKIPSSERQALIQDLAEKGLIKVEKEQIKDVWLTELGQEYLIQELAPSGTSTISLNLFKNYVQFIRKATQTQPASTERSSTSPSNDIADIASPITSFHVPKGDELLQGTSKNCLIANEQKLKVLLYRSYSQ